MKLSFSFTFIFLQILLCVTAKGFYSIVAPGTIQSQYEYSVSVTLHGHCAPATIKVGITGPSYNETKTIYIAPSNTEVINFNLPKLKEGQYQLQSEGIRGLIFKNSTDLNYKNKEPEVYIQTDKAIYKPGDLVLYRIVVLDENTRPAKLEEPLRLGIKDAAQNLIKQINDIKLSHGVYSGEFQLSEQPVLGFWMFEVSLGKNYDDTTTQKQFEVAKYVLPKFSVDIETAKDVAYADGVIKVTIRSTYTYGKPVKGKATVTADVNYGQAKSEKTIDVDGKGYVEFDIAKDLQLTKDAENESPYYYWYSYVQTINILAVMTEELTGNKQNKTAMVNLYQSRYNIEVPNYVYEYVANKTFEMIAYVKNLDGSPVQDSKQVATLRISKNSIYYYSEIKTVEDDFVFESKLDKNGKAVFKVKIPVVGYHSARIIYADKTLYLPGLSGMLADEKKPDKEDVGPLKLVLKTEKPKLGECLAIEVKSNQSIPYYVYNIVARGNIIKQVYVKVPKKTQSHSFSFKPTFEMVPYFSIFVYFVLNGDLIFQEMTIDLPREFENKIAITAPKQAKPSEEVTLNIKTDPNSFVGLLGVDQSVLLLQTGNDLDSNRIFDDLYQYNTETPYIMGYGIYPGQTSGLVTQTNANYPYSTDFYPPIYYIRQPVFLARNELAATSLPSPDGLTVPPMPVPGPVIEPQIRKEFIETWIFNNLNSDSNGLVNLTKNIPDTITSWVVTGFSLNDKTGFGMVENPTKIEVFLPFFISTNLPYSVKRGEVISIPIIVFNYMDTDLDAEVTMENTDQEYDFTEASNGNNEVVLEDKQRVKRVTVPSNSGQTVFFMIRPNIVGEITLNLKAITPLAGDAMQQKLKVEPEGYTQYENLAIFIALSPTQTTFRETLKAVIPTEAVLDSEYLEFSVFGDILGPTIKNIDQLVRMPYGCGEQNMVNFVPNILVLHYLEAIKRDLPIVEENARKYMEVGYQRELTYKHKNGAYSAFGEGSSEASSWLTAYVARSFIQARKYITIDSAIIEQALEYLVANQLESGQFNQTGKLFHPSHQNDVGFTAFAVLAFLEDVDYATKYKAQIDKAVKYLVDNIDKEEDTYALSIALLALKKVNNPQTAKLMEKLEKVAKEENGLKWWTKSLTDQSNDVEITAYILESYVATEPTGKLLPIIKWLIANRNSNGGFDSTQDTVVGLQALITFAEKYAPGGDGKMTITFAAQDGEGKETTNGSFSIDQDNSLLLQTQVLPKSSRQITLEAVGQGSSLVQLSYRYNLASKDDKPSFNVIHTIKPSLYPSQLLLNICAEYVPPAGEVVNESNMAVMEIFLPSGYTADSDKFNDILQVKQIQRVETKNSETAIIIYFDSLLAGEQSCFDVVAEKTHAVAKQKPAAIAIYDYYKPEQRATVYYGVESSLCDICVKEDCGKGCETIV